jgi:hypothetical protein
MPDSIIMIDLLYHSSNLVAYTSSPPHQSIHHHLMWASLSSHSLLMLMTINAIALQSLVCYQPHILPNLMVSIHRLILNLHKFYTSVGPIDLSTASTDYTKCSLYKITALLLLAMSWMILKALLDVIEQLFYWVQPW